MQYNARKHFADRGKGENIQVMKWKWVKKKKNKKNYFQQMKKG